MGVTGSELGLNGPHSHPSSSTMLRVFCRIWKDRKLFISQSWGTVRRDVRGTNIYDRLLHPVCFSHAVFFNTCEEGIHYLYFRSDMCVYTYTYWNSMPGT